MASLVRRAMVYLGLVDDDEYEYETYDDPQPVAAARPSRVYGPEPETATSSIRTLPREDPSGITVSPLPSRVRPIVGVQNVKVQVVAPVRFPDAQEIGDRYKENQPVIVNLQAADRELSRRMIDFCSGLTYGLGGNMEKVADQVFLLTPSNVELPAEEKRKLQERGLYNS